MKRRINKFRIAKKKKKIEIIAKNVVIKKIDFKFLVAKFNLTINLLNISVY